MEALNTVSELRNLEYLNGFLYTYRQVYRELPKHLANF